MVQPQRDLKGSLRENSVYSEHNPFIHWFTEHLFLNAKHVLGIGDGALNEAALAHKELTPHACV